MNPCIAEKSPFGTRIENVRDYVYRSLLQKVPPRMCFKTNYVQRVPFYHKLFQKLVKPL